MESNAPLTRFIDALPGLTVTRLSQVRRDRLAALAEELSRVNWDRPEGVREILFHPIGLPGTLPFPVGEHFRGYRKLAVSPYVRDEAIGRLLRVRRGEKAVLVSRGAESPQFRRSRLEQLRGLRAQPRSQPLRR